MKRIIALLSMVLVSSGISAHTSSMPDSMRLTLPLGFSWVVPHEETAGSLTFHQDNLNFGYIVGIGAETPLNMKMDMVDRFTVGGSFRYFHNALSGDAYLFGENDADCNTPYVFDINSYTLNLDGNAYFSQVSALSRMWWWGLSMSVGANIYRAQLSGSNPAADTVDTAELSINLDMKRHNSVAFTAGVGPFMSLMHGGHEMRVAFLYNYLGYINSGTTSRAATAGTDLDTALKYHKHELSLLFTFVFGDVNTRMR